jgi:hypothetical protein
MNFMHMAQPPAGMVFRVLSLPRRKAVPPVIKVVCAKRARLGEGLFGMIWPSPVVPKQVKRA